uniref:Decapping nuclease n=1 Tax=Timema douglasi TaxID=61478 RepID=A0A7R8VEA0_TIMDO|nr:unnamed protein product [Timema douglasi]
MCTPYENLDDWIICASKWKGNIYLCAIESEESIKKRKSRTEQQKKFMSWGYKFEQYMTADKPKGRPKTDDPVNEKEEFCVMFQSKMRDHNLLYGAEMDCVDSETEVLTEQDLANAHFIELKTNRMIEDRRQDMNFRRFKLRKIWCQSFLVGIDTVVCGYRDDAGVVHQLEELELREIPKMTKVGGR